jgi:APA family basic amino acid/polyamine antiporter
MEEYSRHEGSAMQGVRFVRRLGTWDIALIVIGSVIASGIFRTPQLVAQRAPNADLILIVWAVGGVVNLFGAFVLGELAARRPGDCGAYAYLRDAFHPIVGFAFGWAGLLAMYTGGLAAAAILFAGYFISLTGINVAPAVVGAAALGILALLNVLGVREGTSAQNAMSVLKVAAILAIVAAGLLEPARFVQPPNDSSRPLLATLGAFSVALVPVIFAYAGVTVATFMTAETKDPARALPIGLTIGMVAVTVVYVLVNAACIRSLGISGLAHTDVPAAAVLSNATGTIGTRLASIAIALSTLGYLSNRMLTVPRMYHAMAADGLFFPIVASVNPRTKVPTVAILLQTLVAIVILLSASYGHIINYVVAVIAAFGGLLALALFVLRARDRAEAPEARAGFRVPFHPVSTAIFMLVSWSVAIATCIAYPVDGLMGLAIVFSGVPVYWLWSRSRFARRLQA